MTIAPLPRRLEYLGPVLAALAAQDGDFLDESTDTTYLCVVLKSRISGKGPKAAQTILSEDKDVLEEWLSAQPVGPAHFVFAFLSEPAELARYLLDFRSPKNWKPPRPRRKRKERLIQMQVPPGFESRREGSGLYLQRGTGGSRTSVGVSFAQRSPSPRQILKMVSEYPDVTLIPVAFGSLKGTRLVREGLTRSLFLKLGAAELCISISGKADLVEPYIHTIKIDEREV
jgi:hypothetical protein